MSTNGSKLNREGAPPTTMTLTFFDSLLKTAKNIVTTFYVVIMSIENSVIKSAMGSFNLR